MKINSCLGAKLDLDRQVIVDYVIDGMDEAWPVSRREKKIFHVSTSLHGGLDNVGEEYLVGAREILQRYRCPRREAGEKAPGGVDKVVQDTAGFTGQRERHHATVLRA